MRLIFCNPKITMLNTGKAEEFFDECTKIFDEYVADKVYIFTKIQLNQVLASAVDKNDIFVFFTSENGEYIYEIIKLIEKYVEAKSRIWPIAMEGNPECRVPPEIIKNVQSFDFSCRNENRNPLKNNVRAVAHIFARKVVAQTLSPLYNDEVLYFVSHKRSDGEHLAARISDGIKKITRERIVYRDIVHVEVGSYAQEDIDKNLELSDVVIFIQTPEAKDSKWIMKELCYAMINDIPILWIQVDNASYDDLEIRPGERPVLSYMSQDFDNDDKLIDIVDEIERSCFQLIMNSSNQVFSYIQCLSDMKDTNQIRMQIDKDSIFAYEIRYELSVRDLYNSNQCVQYIQCFGRNPKQQDIRRFFDRIKETNYYTEANQIFVLSNHGKRDKERIDSKIIEENYDDYIMNIENGLGIKREFNNKKIIISGAFPDCDEIYKSSLIEALVVYSREIIKRGYTLVFGAHPTFQNIIFDIGELYSSDVKKSIQMHMSEDYVHLYDLDKLEKHCTLLLSKNLDYMRKNMICDSNAELIICMGGKIKEDKMQQGVDQEIELAKSAQLPIVLVGTVGGRSSEYAYEIISGESNYTWNDLNPWDSNFNECLFYNVNHRLMIRKILENIETHKHEGEE